MKKRRIFLVFLFILLFGIAASGVAALYMWNRPLGPSLDLPALPSATLPAVGSNSSNTTVVPNSTEQVLTSNSPITSTQVVNSGQPGILVPSPTATSLPLCGGPTTMTILAIGSDERSTGYLYGLGDSIHVARIDFTVPNIMVIDFPRDLWVEIPDISSHYGLTHGKLNQAYLFGNPGMGYYDGPGEGPGLMARTLYVNFGLRVDHYVAIDTQTFVKLIDTIGGVDITVDEPIDLNYYNAIPDPKLSFSVGTHHVDGQVALALATDRIPTTFQRMKYEKIILSALRDKLLSPSMVPKLPKLVAQFISSVQTDLTPSEINNLICIGQAVPKANIIADSFPQEMFKASSIYDTYRKVYAFIYVADFNKLREMVAEFMNGVWPMP